MRKFANLRKIFERNFRVTRLYATYLESFPELITKELLDSVCEGGDISKETAISAILCQLLGLDAEGSAEDRVIFRDYIIPSVKLLDANKYKSNPYYKSINIPSVKDGAWELRQEAYEPYRAVVCGDMIMREDFSEVAPLGFFEERFEFPAILENGNEWMTLTPVDLDTCQEAINAARGRVVTFGLGLGYYAYMVSIKPDVESVTVVERSEEVIALFKKYILPQFPSPEKINIIAADAIEYAKLTMPGEKFDVAFVDVWRDASDGSEFYKKMKPCEALCPTTEFHWWIENFIVCRLRALKFEKLSQAFDDGMLKASYEEITRTLTDKQELIKE